MILAPVTMIFDKSKGAQWIPPRYPVWKGVCPPGDHELFPGFDSLTGRDHGIPSDNADPPFGTDGRDNPSVAHAFEDAADLPAGRDGQDVSFVDFIDVSFGRDGQDVSFVQDVSFQCDPSPVPVSHAVRHVQDVQAKSPKSPSQCLGRKSDRDHLAVAEQDSQSQVVAESQAGMSQTRVVEFNSAGPTRQPRVHASFVVDDLTSLSLLTCLSMLECLQLSPHDQALQECLKLSPCLWKDAIQVEVAERKMVKLWLFKIKSFEYCERQEVKKGSWIGEMNDHQDRSPGMKLDRNEFEIVEEGCAGKSTKQPQSFHEEIKAVIATEQSSMELGQLHMSSKVEVFGEKDSHLRECKKFATPRFGNESPKYDPRLEYKSGVQMFLYQATHKANFNWIEPVVCTRTWKLMMKPRLGVIRWNSDDDRRRMKFYQWRMVTMSSSEEKKRANSDAARFVLQVIKSGHVFGSFHLVLEQGADLVVEIKLVKDDNSRFDFSQDFSRGKQEWEHDVHAHPTHTEQSAEVLHWSSVGRVSEIQGDIGTDSRAGSFPILSGYSRNGESQPSLPEHKDPSFGVNRITKDRSTGRSVQVYM